jgi:cation transport regulator ChaB
VPYDVNSDLPKSVKSALPEKAQTIWRTVFNDAYEDNGDNAFAIAWAALRNAGWSKEDGIWVEVKKEFLFDIQKSLDEKQLAFGWAVISRDVQGSEVWDKQDDAIDPSELEDLAYNYVEFYRDAGELHINRGKGVLIESVVTTLEKQQIWGVPTGSMPVGWWCGFHITDVDVWSKIKQGIYRAFSIEGTAQRVEVM